MQPLRWESRPDGLRAPALVCAFKGWNDAGDAASAALQFVGASLKASRFATIDPEEFYDFQATRPRVAFTEGRTREITRAKSRIWTVTMPGHIWPTRPKRNSLDHPGRERPARLAVDPIPPARVARAVRVKHGSDSSAGSTDGQGGL